MNKNLDIALQEVELTYENLVSIANDIVNPILIPINNKIKDMEKHNINLYGASLDSLRVLLLDLSIKSYSLSEIKDKAVLKQEIAETLRKEEYARQFNGNEGTVAVKENIALLNSSEQYLVEIIYNLVSSLLKTKLDEVHRLVNAITTIIMSKMSEMKINQTMSIGEVGESTYLKE